MSHGDWEIDLIAALAVVVIVGLFVALIVHLAVG